MDRIKQRLNKQKQHHVEVHQHRLQQVQHFEQLYHTILEWLSSLDPTHTEKKESLRMDKRLHLLLPPEKTLIFKLSSQITSIDAPLDATLTLCYSDQPRLRTTLQLR